MTTLIKPVLTPTNPNTKKMIGIAKRFAATCRIQGYTANVQPTLDGYALIFPKRQNKAISSRTIASKFQRFRKTQNTKGLAFSIQDLPGRSAVAWIVRLK